MKNAGVILGSLSLAGVIALFALFFSKKDGGSANVITSSGAGGSAKLAYVNIDSFQTGYTYMKNWQDDFKQRQEKMETELQHSYQQFQADAGEMQKKAQGGMLTQAETNMAEKRLMQMQQSLETRKQALSEQLLKEHEDFNKELKEDFDAFFEDYNKTHHYDFIYYYSASASSLLYVNKQLDITKEVVEGMNARAKNKTPKK